MAGTTDLQIELFHDYHGDGQQQAEEPSIIDLILEIEGIGNDYAGTIQAESDGKYWARNVPVGGSYQIIPGADRFGYVALSNAEFRSIRDYYYPVNSDEPSIRLGLMEGFLTSPFGKNDSYTDIEAYVDLDPRPNYIRDWMGAENTYDGHRGTDFIAHKGTEILVAAPGWIFFAWNGWPNKPTWGDSNDTWKNGNSVIIYHGNDYWSEYNHLNSIAVNEASWGYMRQFVKRGDVIGYMGYTGFRPDLVTLMTPNQVHLHFEMTDTDINMGSQHARDPFRDLYYGKHGDSPRSNSVTLWSKDNDLQHPQP
jgi:murein DD-endopeptidase MepM/ murein hydrolase activator NlpD